MNDQCVSAAAPEDGASDESPDQPQASGYGQRGPRRSLEGLLIRTLLNRLGRPPIRVVLPCGTVVCNSPAPPQITVRIRNRRTLWSLLWQPSIGFGEGYRRGAIEVDGDLVTLCELVEPTQGATRGRFWRGVRGSRRRRAADPQASRDNIHRHYDLGNDFYRLWLDTQMVYTCAYFPVPSASLEEAQTAKLDLVCRKMNLQPGQCVFEAGCGWGALALHMARNYGVRVVAWNISREQVAYAQERARVEGLTDQVRFIEDDWRAMRGRCDAFVSVGMLEHVGPENYREFGRCIDQVLSPNGTGLIHTIGRDIPERIDGWTERYIFPGAEPPSLGQMMEIFEPCRMVILDVENLRLHYALTLEHWLARFEARSAQIQCLFDESFVRAWRLYLAGSLAAFRCASLQLFQVVFTRCANNHIPWTRRDAEAGFR